MGKTRRNPTFGADYSRNPPISRQREIPPTTHKTLNALTPFERGQGVECWESGATGGQAGVGSPELEDASECFPSAHLRRYLETGSYRETKE